MIAFSRKATQHLEDLWRYYEEYERLEALRNLTAAMADAIAKIERNPGAGLAAPRPYPSLAKPGRAWVKAGRYWVMYRTTKPPVITGIFYDAADIPDRL
ncbi:MAG TPA: type II toxin-antitoxin system RelE/ParE family toxin [Stellaceae bacterium]|nr:type II toxin-antitoxin system RelE/ParE family toxin [Stellaceae bacterium]